MQLGSSIRSYVAGLAIGGTLVAGFLGVKHLRVRHTPELIVRLPTPAEKIDDDSEAAPEAPPVVLARMADDRRQVIPAEGAEPPVELTERAAASDLDLDLELATAAVARAQPARSVGPIDAAFGQLPAGLPVSCRRYLAAVTRLGQCTEFPTDARAAMIGAGKSLTETWRAVGDDSSALATMTDPCSKGLDAMLQAMDATCPELGSRAE